jgi:hypothetical protein
MSKMAMQSIGKFPLWPSANEPELQHARAEIARLSSAGDHWSAVAIAALHASTSRIGVNDAALDGIVSSELPQLIACPPCGNVIAPSCPSTKAAFRTGKVIRSIDMGESHRHPCTSNVVTIVERGSLTNEGRCK